MEYVSTFNSTFFSLSGFLFLLQVVPWFNHRLAVKKGRHFFEDTKARKRETFFYNATWLVILALASYIDFRATTTFFAFVVVAAVVIAIVTYPIRRKQRMRTLDDEIARAMIDLSGMPNRK